MDFIYERFWLPNGIKIEEVTGGSHYKGKVWQQIARQIYCENGKDGFRDIGHFQSGAPFIYGAEEKISISHTDGMLAVATIPVETDNNLSVFSLETALGIDVEKKDREKVLKLRERFLSEEELKLIPSDSLEAGITAWTCKEAMLKAGMNPTIDWHHDIIIIALPTPDSPGEGYIYLDSHKYKLTLIAIHSEDHIICVATSKPAGKRRLTFNSAQ